MRTSDYDYELPPDRIAQAPASPRDASRLLIVPKAGGPLRHAIFRDLVGELREGDLLVLNDTRVVPARLFGIREKTGGKTEVLLCRETATGLFEALLGSRGRLLTEERVLVGGGAEAGGLTVTVLGKSDEGIFEVAVEPAAEVHERMDRLGVMPLPPYIRRGPGSGALALEDLRRYQTVFAARRGAVAAPTAGLHFTEELLARLAERGVRRSYVTLHVGIGTFRPVAVEDASAHRMHEEAYEVPEATIDALAEARRRGGRIIACGTTVVRALETLAATGEARGLSRLFIRPPYAFRYVDALITNFHLPRSTLLMLVAALVGRERLLEAYQAALADGYRFYSYGDAMLIA